jgi:Flp pilus assembly protein TadB
MRWFKVAAVAAGVLIAYFVVSALIGYFILGAMGALVIAVIVLAVKVRSRRQVSREEQDREIHESVYSTPPRRQEAPNVDDELARLKREMRS